MVSWRSFHTGHWGGKYSGEWFRIEHGFFFKAICIKDDIKKVTMFQDNYTN